MCASLWRHDEKKFLELLHKSFRIAEGILDPVTKCEMLVEVLEGFIAAAGRVSTVRALFSVGL